jgi:hypothetical protein
VLRGAQHALSMYEAISTQSHYLLTKHFALRIIIHWEQRLRPLHDTLTIQHSHKTHNVLHQQAESLSPPYKPSNGTPLSPITHSIRLALSKYVRLSIVRAARDIQSVYLEEKDHVD